MERGFKKRIPLPEMPVVPPQGTLKNMVVLVSFCLCVLPHLGSTAQNLPNGEAKSLELPTFSVLQKTESIELDAAGRDFTVRYPPILPNSERITDADGKMLVRGIDYQIDFYLGKITFGKTEEKGAPQSSTPPSLQPNVSQA